MNDKTDVTKVKAVYNMDHMQKAMDGSYYFISGAGGDLNDWVKGYEDLMVEKEIGTPKEWWSTTGAVVNLFAGSSVHERDRFANDLTCLLFPLDGLQMGRLAMFKIEMENRWFDDVIQNMRRH